MLPELLNEQLRLVDGTIVKKCPTTKPLYCSKDGRFFSVRNMQITDGGCIMHELKPRFSPSSQKNRPNMHSSYPNMRDFGARLCHHLIYETWVGPRTKGMEIDHVNGNMMDWSLSNLEEVTPAENRKRAKILRCMREAGNDPKQYSPARLKNIFAQYSLMDGDTQMIREMTKHQEL
jgi:hypothetical protein